MKRTPVLAFALLMFLTLPSRLVCQDTPAQETYKGEPLCSTRRGVYPHRVYTPDPSYDDKDRKKRTQGTVLLSTIVTKEGETADIKVEKTLTPGLDKEAVKAVSRWKFDPMIIDGKSCATRIKIEVEFRLY